MHMEVRIERGPEERESMRERAIKVLESDTAKKLRKRERERKGKKAASLQR